MSGRESRARIGLRTSSPENTRPQVNWRRERNWDRTFSAQSIVVAGIQAGQILTGK